MLTGSFELLKNKTHWEGRGREPSEGTFKYSREP